MFYTFCWSFHICFLCIKVSVISYKVYICTFSVFLGSSHEFTQVSLEGQRIADNHTPKEVSIISSLNSRHILNFALNDVVRWYH